MNLKEIGTLQDKPEYKLIDGDYPDSYIAKFTLDGNDIEVFLSNNPLSVLPQIDSIYNTNYKEEYIDSYSEDFIENLPPKFQKVGSIDFRVNDKSDIPKIRQQNNVDPNIEYNQLVRDNQNIINQATRYGFRNVNDALRSENNNPLLYKLVIQNRRLFQRLNDLSRQIPTYKELPKEEPNIKFYIQALNQSVSIARDFFNKTKPNIIIVNFPSELPNEITSKRNNIYRQYIEKYLSQDYNIKEKNGILYLEKQNLQEMNEIKRLQQLAGILTEIKVNNPQPLILYRKNLIQDMWNYEDEDFWEDTGFDRSNINAFNESMDDYQVIVNYFDTVGDSEKLERIQEYIDGKDITDLVKDYTSMFINEIKINNPNEVYSFQNWVIPYHDNYENGKIDYDYLMNKLGEDTADAIQMTSGIKNPFKKKDIDSWLNNEWEDCWDGDSESFINWLKEYEII